MSGFNFKFSTWTAPHWLVVVGSAVGGAVLSYAETALVNGIPSSTTAWEALAKGAALAGIAALVGVAKQILSPVGQAVKNAQETLPGVH
jgi:hypothetical protein